MTKNTGHLCLTFGLHVLQVFQFKDIVCNIVTLLRRIFLIDIIVFAHDYIVHFIESLSNLIVSVMLFLLK